MYQRMVLLKPTSNISHKGSDYRSALCRPGLTFKPCHSMTITGDNTVQQHMTLLEPCQYVFNPGYIMLSADGGYANFANTLVTSYHLSWRYNLGIKLFHHTLYDISTTFLETHQLWIESNRGYSVTALWD